MMALIQDDTVPLQIETIASSERIKELTMAKIHTKTHKRINKASRMLLIAAVAVMVLTASALAVVTLNFGLKDMQGRTAHSISSNGFSGMPEYEAGVEWSAYLHEAYEEGTNDPPLPDETGHVEEDSYYKYGAYSQEAKDTLDALLEKYGLKMHESRTECRSIEALYNAAGKEGFMPAVGDNVADGDEYPLSGGDKYPISGVYYDDGTFNFTCGALLSDGRSILYNVECIAKGTFTRDAGVNGGPDEYEEWSYTTEGGTDVLLAISKNKSILAADLDNCYVFINIRSGTVNDSGDGSMGAPTVDKSDLEALAEEFDFVVINSLSE